MTKENEIKIAVLETKFEQMEKTLEEVRKDCQETKDSLISITPKIDGIIISVDEMKKSKPDSNDLLGFVRTNYKMLLVVFAVMRGVDFTGQQVIDLISHNSAAPVAAQEHIGMEHGK